MYHTDGQAHFRCLPDKRYIKPCMQGTASWEGGSVMVYDAFSYDHILQLTIRKWDFSNSQKHWDDILKPFFVGSS